MTIDLKYFIPFAMPLTLLGFFRLMWWLAGAGWAEPSMAASLSCIIGFAVGAGIVALLEGEKVKWNIKIGGKP